MRLLLVTDRPPYPPNGGGKITMWNIVRRLSQQHELILLSFYDSDSERTSIDVLGRYCERVEFVKRRPKFSFQPLVHALRRGTSFGVARNSSPEMVALIRRVLHEETVDLIQVETFYMMQHLPVSPEVPVILDMHNVTWLVWQRAARTARFPLRTLAKIEADRTFRDELRACRRATIAVVTSEEELRLMHEAAPDVACRVIQPGVDCSEFQIDSAIEPGENELIFVGTLSYLPNADGVRYFCREILPLIASKVPDVHLTIVGNAGRSLRSLGNDPRVTLTGMVADVRPFVQRASVSVVPIRIGGGIRMKILEAMALGSPVVSTSVGCEGLGLRVGSEVLIGDDRVSFSNAVVSLLTDRARREKLSRQAREAAVERHSWDVFVERFNRAYDDVVMRDRSPRLAGEQRSTAV